MATPLTYDQLVAALRREGLNVELFPGSRDRCRCHNGSHDQGVSPSGRQWGPVNGVMVHITAGMSSDLNSYIENVLLNDPSLPCKVQMCTKPDGTVVVLSAGRCNHAGKISAQAVDLSAQDAWPTTGYTDRRGSSTDGNIHFYGIENIATTSMTDAQRHASVLICAAICRAHGWTGQGVCGHGEASSERDYSDPNLDMGAFRRDVMARVKAGPDSSTTITSSAIQPASTTTQEDIDMTKDELVTVLRQEVPTIVDQYIVDLADGKRGLKVLLHAAAIAWHAAFGQKPKTKGDKLSDYYDSSDHIRDMIRTEVKK